MHLDSHEIITETCINKQLDHGVFSIRIYELQTASFRFKKIPRGSMTDLYSYKLDLRALGKNYHNIR